MPWQNSCRKRLSIQHNGRSFIANYHHSVIENLPSPLPQEKTISGKIDGPTFSRFGIRPWKLQSSGRKSSRPNIQLIRKQSKKLSSKGPSSSIRCMFDEVKSEVSLLRLKLEAELSKYKKDYNEISNEENVERRSDNTILTEKLLREIQVLKEENACLKQTMTQLEKELESVKGEKCMSNDVLNNHSRPLKEPSNLVTKTSYHTSSSEEFVQDRNASQTSLQSSHNTSNKNRSKMQNLCASIESNNKADPMKHLEIGKPNIENDINRGTENDRILLVPQLENKNAAYAMEEFFTFGGFTLSNSVQPLLLLPIIVEDESSISEFLHTSCRLGFNEVVILIFRLVVKDFFPEHLSPDMQVLQKLTRCFGIVEIFMKDNKIAKCTENEKAVNYLSSLLEKASYLSNEPP